MEWFKSTNFLLALFTYEYFSNKLLSWVCIMEIISSYYTMGQCFYKYSYNEYIQCVYLLSNICDTVQWKIANNSYAQMRKI